MKKGTQIERFPESALLFRFCLAALQHRRPNGKAHDQEIGNILQYNASDTSHWKRGKKAVKSIYALEALARALDVDFDTLHDICDGSLDFDEAWYEFIESESWRAFLASRTPELSEEHQVRKQLMEELATQLLAAADIRTVPVHIPELATAFPFIQLVQGEVSDKLARSSRIKQGSYSVRFRKGEMRSHTRVAIAREVARIVVQTERSRYGLPPKIDSLLLAELFDLSNALLVPKSILREEFQRVPARLNTVKILADTFWVPKTIIRSRLVDIIVSSVPTSILTDPTYTVRENIPLKKVALGGDDFSEEDQAGPGEIESVFDQPVQHETT